MGQTNVGGISVSGEGFVETRPDTAWVHLGFTTQNTSLAAARQETAANMAAVLDRLRDLGVAAEDMQTSGYNIWQDEKRRHFVVSNGVSVTIRDVDSSSKLLDEAVAAGANQVRGVSFGVRERAEFESQARAMAMRDAQRKAGELARLGGVELGAPVLISESHGYGSHMHGEWTLAAATGEMGSVDMPVEAGQTSVNINVQVTYAIK